MTPSTALFDLFGTLVPSPPMSGYRAMVDRIAAIADVQSDEFFEKWMSVNDERLLGTFGSSEGDIEHVIRKFGVELSASNMDECMHLRRAATRDWIGPLDGALAALEELRGLGIKLGLVTDSVFDVPGVWEHSPLSSQFSAAVFSCEQHFRKPDSVMYTTALELLGATAADTVFVGDGGSSELEGAERLGIRAIKIDDQPGVQPSVLSVDVQEWSGDTVRSFRELVELIRQG
jgi:putative hydrolase of the HAD superfamily